MTLLKFINDEWGPVGSFNWFATHGTSMSRTNSLISGDNKGAAARFMEDWAEQNGYPKQTDSAYPDTIMSGIGHKALHRRISIIIPQPHEKCKSYMCTVFWMIHKNFAFSLDTFKPFHFL